MLHIDLQGLGKRYAGKWIIKDLNYTIQSGDRLALAGANGSGKSTLMSILIGILPQSSGQIIYQHEGLDVRADDLSLHLSYAAPYVQFAKDLTAEELYDLVKSQRPMYTASFAEFLSLSDLKGHEQKRLRQYSDGMRQRLGLSIAFDLQSSCLLFDEPTHFLDQKYKEWYADLLGSQLRGRTLIVASNDSFDFQSCTTEISTKNFL